MVRRPLLESSAPTREHFRSVALRAAEELGAEFPPYQAAHDPTRAYAGGVVWVRTSWFLVEFTRYPQADRFPFRLLRAFGVPVPTEHWYSWEGLSRHPELFIAKMEATHYLASINNIPTNDNGSDNLHRNLRPRGTSTPASSSDSG